MEFRLSKSRYTAGVQCHKLPWWKVREPLAVELREGDYLAWSSSAYNHSWQAREESVWVTLRWSENRRDA